MRLKFDENCAAIDVFEEDFLLLFVIYMIL